MATSKFYMVLVQGGSSPEVRHPDYESARAEAERLAQKTGRAACILSSKVWVSPNPAPLRVTPTEVIPFRHE